MSINGFNPTSLTRPMMPTTNMGTANTTPFSMPPNPYSNASTLPGSNMSAMNSGDAINQLLTMLTSFLTQMLGGAGGSAAAQKPTPQQPTPQKMPVANQAANKPSPGAGEDPMAGLMKLLQELIAGLSGQEAGKESGKAGDKPGTNPYAPEGGAKGKGDCNKPAADKPAAEKPTPEKPSYEKPAAEKPAEKPAADKPTCDKPAEKPSYEKPAPEKPKPETPSYEKPAPEKPKPEKPSCDKPKPEKPSYEKPAPEKPEKPDKPKPDKPTPDYKDNPDSKYYGDPHFVGFGGEKYDVMGEAGKTYNILSDKDLQYNGKFVAWDKKPGSTVIGEAGITSGKDQLEYKLGDTPKLNGKALESGKDYSLDGGGKAKWDGSKMHYENNEYTIDLSRDPSNKDAILSNVKVKGGANPLADGVAAHGLLGQTADGVEGKRVGKNSDGSEKTSKNSDSKQGGTVIDGSYKDYEVKDLLDIAFGKNNKFAG